MTFKEFSKWCNERACDGCWGIAEAMICMDVGTEIHRRPWFLRERAWQNHASREMVERIVQATNALIERAIAEEVDE